MISIRNRFFSLAAILTLVLIRGVLIYLDKTYQLYLIGTYDIPIFIDTLIVAIVAVAFISLNSSNKTVKVLFYIFVLLFALYIFADKVLFAFFTMEMKEYCYVSPGKTHTLIIDEGSFLLGANIEVYKKKNFIFKKKLPNIDIRTDDGYTPFGSGEFRLNWLSEREVDITYFANFESKDKEIGWRSVKVIFD